AFPAAKVATSGGAEVIAQVGGEPAVIVATPGAEPRAEAGYAAAVLLDGWALLGRASLRASEEALRRRLHGAARGRPGPEGGCVAVAANAALSPVQALVRWAPVPSADRELSERNEPRSPPAIRLASLTGPEDAVREVLDAAELPPGADVLGPVPVADSGRRGRGGPRAGEAGPGRGGGGRGGGAVARLRGVGGWAGGPAAR